MSIYTNIYIYGYIYICICIYIYKYVYNFNKFFNFNKYTIFELGIGMPSSFSGMALNAFWKRALYVQVGTWIIKTNHLV